MLTLLLTGVLARSVAKLLATPSTPLEKLRITLFLWVKNGTRMRSRTSNLLIRSQVLYPIELCALPKSHSTHGPAQPIKSFLESFV